MLAEALTVIRDQASLLDEAADMLAGQSVETRSFNAGWDACEILWHGRVCHPNERKAAAAPSSDSPAKWGNADTVGNLIAQLRTLDPDASIQAGYHVTMPDGTNRAKVRGLHLSRERVVGNNIVNDKDVPLSYVAWAGDPTPASHTAPTDTNAEAEVLREALEEAHTAIAEYYRYRTGGETRGSYDGKPERDGLWKAQRKARAALNQGRQAS